MLYTQDYVNGIEYKNGNLEAIYHSEGRVTTIDGTLKYEYAMKDHLGNTRLMFCDRNGDGVIKPENAPEASEVTQENSYYAFGMNMEFGAWENTPSVTDNLHQYNGKELNTDFGLNWNDYGARFYDPATARWNAIDPMAERYLAYNPYNYVMNNPIKSIDPNGMETIVTTGQKDGKEHINIKFTAVLVDKTQTLNKSQLTQLKADIIKQLKASYSGSSANRSWDINVKLRIGSEARGKENTINIVNDKSGSNGSKGGLEANIARLPAYGSIADNVVHEVGHNMGLPHIVSNLIENTSYNLGKVSQDYDNSIQPEWSLIKGTSVENNSMLDGGSQDVSKGTEIIESQIEHIRSDYNNGLLNRKDVNGGDSAWGNLSTDRPVYQFYMNKDLGKVQFQQFKLVKQ